MKVLSLSSFVSLAFVLGRTAAIVSCNFNGKKDTHGPNNHDDYTIACRDNKLSGIYKRGTLYGSVEPAFANGTIRCNWGGPRRFSGANSCDDFMLECYDNHLYSIKAIEGCGRTQYERYGSNKVGPVCNFASPLRFNGIKRGDDFQFDCNDGNIDRVDHLERGRRLGESLKTKNTESIISNKTHSIAEAFVADGGNDEVVLGRKLRNIPNQCTVWEQPVGRWVPVFDHNDFFERAIEYGTELTRGEELTKSLSTSLQVAVESGVKFLGSGSTTTVTATVSTLISTTMTTSFTKRYGETITTHCSNGGSLFQWVVDAKRASDTDVSATVYASSTMCIGYGLKPQCPLKACADEDCQTCEDWKDGLSNDGDDETNGGYFISECNWSGEERLSGVHREDDYMFNCFEGKIVGTRKMGSFRNLAEEDVNTCASCDWNGVRHFSGENVCDDVIMECYDGFFYGMTLVGHSKHLHAGASCGGDVRPAEVLTGTQCNWSGDKEFHTAESYAAIRVMCSAGRVTNYRYRAA